MSSSHVQEDYPLVGSYGGENRNKFIWIGGIAFVCWNILLFSLAVAAIAKVNNFHEAADPVPAIFSQSVSSSAANTVPQMSVVSLLSDGTVRTGAGTTIYSKTSPPPPFGVGSQNLRVARFVDQGSVDQVIVVWTNNTGSYAVLGTLSLDKQQVSGWFASVKLPFETFSDLITLANNHFIIATDTAIWAGTANTQPGAMNITALASADYPEPIWRDIRLTALGLSNFVVTYDTGFIAVNASTTFGAIVGSVVWDVANKVPTVSFSTTAVKWEGGFPVHAVFALTDTTFVVAYGTPSTPETSPELACKIGRFAPGPPATLNFGNPVIYAGIEPQFHLSAIGLDDSTGVIVVVDRENEYALRAVLVHRNPNAIDAVHYGDVKTVESGVADNIFLQNFQNGALPFIDTAKISSKQVAVAWADYSNSGRLTTAILTMDQAANVHVSPLYVIGQSLTINQLVNYTVSVAGLSIDAYGQIGAVVIDRKSSTDASSSGNVALVEVAPKAFGVAAHTAFQGKTVEVVVTGLINLPASFPTDLKPGYIYYGRTDGSLEAGPLAGTVDKSTYYITLSDGSIVTTDSAVGVAVSKRQLYVLPSF